MDGPQIRRLRERHEWKQADLAKILNEGLGRRYGTASVSRWERAEREVPGEVSRFLDALVAGDGEPPVFDDSATSGDAAGPSPADTVPGGDGGGPSPQVPFGAGGTYIKVCRELVETVAIMVGTVGALTGSDPLVQDGKIIDADKDALAHAYGKLAETNETFRRWIMAATMSGAWFEVAVVTGSTAGKIVQNHYTARALREQAEGGGPVDESTDGQPQSVGDAVRYGTNATAVDPAGF